MSTAFQKIRLHPWYSVSIVAWTAFCHPGMFSALNGLGAGGAESPTLSNIINAIVFGVLTVGGLVAGIICNKIGVRWTLILGTLGYAPYAAALYTNAAFGNSWFPIIGALTCGTSAVFLWTASGAINLVVPPVHQRGRAAATKFALQNLGGFIGGAVSLGLNIHQDHSGRVSDGIYGLIVQYQYNSRHSAPIDITNRLFAKSALLFILCGLIENSGMVFGYWIIASLGLDPGSVASFVGLATGVGSLGSTAAFILGACDVELRWQL
ncbi:hypothetical protein BJX62DRAFT_234032 [Aspergillus germanicus]